FYGRFGRNAEPALDDVARRCASDSGCRRAFPRWRSQFSKLVRAWDAHPAVTGKGARTTGAAFAGVVQQMLRDATRAASIRFLVSRAAAGDYAPLRGEIQAAASGPNLQLMYWSVWCNEPWVGLAARGPWGTDFDSYTASALAGYRTTCSLLPRRAE